VAKWLIQRLRAAGVETDEEPGQEDFGWYFELKVPAGRHCCVFGYQPDEPEGTWLLWLERSRGLIGSVLGMRQRGIDATAVRAIHEALASDPEIRDVVWLGLDG
jgi:hypothetical protein